MAFKNTCAKSNRNKNKKYVYVLHFKSPCNINSYILQQPKESLYMPRQEKHCYQLKKVNFDLRKLSASEKDESVKKHSLLSPEPVCV